MELKDIRERLMEVENIVGDVESDIEGLDAMADSMKCRPAIAIVNDLSSLCKELREAMEVDGTKLYDFLDAVPVVDAKTLVDVGEGG